jgi:polynucleotide 5'-kinase involved in rRNA processing
MFSESILIINTHGYINNIGEILFYDICNIINPKFIVVLDKENQGKKENNNLFRYFE